MMITGLLALSLFAQPIWGDASPIPGGLMTRIPVTSGVEAGSTSPTQDRQTRHDHGHDDCLIESAMKAWQPHPVVVELFTSQGCPMCPDANALLGTLSERSDIIAIAYGVDYWDMYGWEDEFSVPDFVARQHDYVERGEAMRVFTPHFVVNGDPHKLKFKPSEILDFIDHQEPLSAEARIHSGHDGYELTLSGPRLSQPAEVWMVTYEEGEQWRAIGGGANAGRSTPHFNMARSLTQIGSWDGGEDEFALPALPDEDHLRAAILVQAERGGRVLAAALFPAHN